MTTGRRSSFINILAMHRSQEAIEQLREHELGGTMNNYSEIDRVMNEFKARFGSVALLALYAQNNQDRIATLQAVQNALAEVSAISMVGLSFVSSCNQDTAK